MFARHSHKFGRGFLVSVRVLQRHQREREQEARLRLVVVQPLRQRSFRGRPHLLLYFAEFQTNLLSFPLRQGCSIVIAALAKSDGEHGIWEDHHKAAFLPGRLRTLNRD